MTEIAFSSVKPTKIDAAAIVVAVTAADGGPQPLDGAAPLDRALRRSLEDALRDLGATGKADEVTKLSIAGKAKAAMVAAVGVGKPAEPGSTEYLETLRRAAGSAARALAGTPAAVFALPVGGPAEAAAIAEGVLLGSYGFDRYKTSNGKAPLERATLVVPRSEGRRFAAAQRRAEIVAEAVNQARTWINTPPRDMTPVAFAAAAVELARGVGLDVSVLDEAALAKGHYGGIIGVGQGSVNPPRLVRVAYRPFRAKKHVALVGKGITFDSGGLSLKTADGMTTMKCDMSGAAAVVAAAIAVARLEPRVALTAYAPMAENMPSGSAQRPSDVLTIRGGKTVEVLNTDAEGRLVLADALARAAEDEPDVIVDVATLTGACRIALGTRIAGVMANTDRLRDHVAEAADRTGEQMWPLPLPPELREKLDSPVADIANIGAKWGGALSAGLFLAEFVPDDVAWAHIDIAGPAFNEESPFGYTPKGGTGAGVRTLVQVVEDVADGRLNDLVRR